MLAVALLLGASAVADEFDEIGISDTCSYFGELMPQSVVLFSSDNEAVDVIDRIVRASGLSKNFDVSAAGVPNAAAVIQEERRLILYNQGFMQDTKRSTGSAWGPISIMAHEVGHHLNGHTLQKGGSRPRLELEADKYSGFVLQRMGATLAEAQAAMSKLGSETGSSTHPKKSDRLAAISSGWTSACEQDARCEDNRLSTPVTRAEPDPGPAPAKKRNVGEVRVDSCAYALDGECDEPGLCAQGTDSTDCSGGSNPGQVNFPGQQVLYCCDMWGQKWCQIVLNPGPVGSPCYCTGVTGTGFICE